MDDDTTLEEKLENTFSSKVVTSPRDLPSNLISGCNLISGRYSKRSTTHHDKTAFLADLPNVIKERQSILESTQNMINSHRLINVDDPLTQTSPVSLRQLNAPNSKMSVKDTPLLGNSLFKPEMSFN